MKKNVILIVLILSALLQPLAHAQGQSTVTIGYFDFPPLYFKGVDGQPQGTLIKRVHEIFQDSPFTPQFSYGTARDLIKGMLEGTVDVALLINYPKLSDKLLYTDLVVEQLNLIAFRGSETPPVHSFDDLAGKNILTIYGYEYGGHLQHLKAMKPAPTLFEASDIHSGLDLLLAGRADYFLSYLRPSQAIAERKGFLLEDRWLVADQLARFDIYMTISRNSSKLWPLYEYFNKQNIAETTE